MTDHVSYEDFASMGIYLTRARIRVKVRDGRFPKPVKGGGINGSPKIGKDARFYWNRKDIVAWASARKKKEPSKA